jgi:hypothetical protein
MFVADFIGGTGKTKVVKFGTPAELSNLAIYGAVQDNVVKRVAIANLDYWNRTSSGTSRPSVALNIEIPASNSGYARVTRINSPDGAGGAADSISYAGSQWTYSSMGKEVMGVKNDTTILHVRSGRVRVTVSSSEAIIVDLSADHNG